MAHGRGGLSQKSLTVRGEKTVTVNDAAGSIIPCRRPLRNRRSNSALGSPNGETVDVPSVGVTCVEFSAWSERSTFLITL